MTLFGIVAVVSVAAVGIARMYFDHKETLNRLEIIEKEQKK